MVRYHICMRRTTVLLPDDLKFQLARAAERRGQPESELIREAITSLLATEPARPRPTVGFVEDGSLATSASIDEAVGEAIGRREGGIAPA